MGGEGDNINVNIVQLVGRTIRTREDERRQEEEEGYAQLKAKAAFFYVDNGLVASTKPEWI